MQLQDSTNPVVLETQERVIVNNLLEYHAELEPTGREICCFGTDIPSDVAIEDILNIECKTAELLEQNRNSFILESGCIFANKEVTKEGSNVLTFGLDGRYILSDGTIRTGTIYIQQGECEPYTHFRIFRHDNLEGCFIKTEIPPSEDSCDFMLLLMHVLAEHRHPLERETEMNRILLKKDIENLECRLLMRTDNTYDYSKKYKLKVIKNKFGELIVDLFDPDTKKYDYRIRRFKNSYIFNSPHLETIEGENRTIPDMDIQRLKVYKRMIAIALNNIQK